MDTPAFSTYHYDSANASCTNGYLWKTVEEIISSEHPPGTRVFDLGCGNGAFARRLVERGYSVSGVDPSVEGIAQAKLVDPEAKLELGSAYDPLVERFGRFPMVISLEVVEHVYYPRLFAACVSELLEPVGLAIISTPYHGYLKNLAISISGKWDPHFTALWDHGHIKFWSPKTLTSLFSEAHLTCEAIHRVGRVPAFAKSMILAFRKAKLVVEDSQTLA